MSEPAANGNNGRDRQGRFGPGNPGGPGNPAAARVAEIRAALFDAADDLRLARVIAGLFEDALHADPAIRLPARRELLDRLLGKPDRHLSLELPEAYIPPAQPEYIVVKRPFAERVKSE